MTPNTRALTIMPSTCRPVANPYSAALRAAFVAKAADIILITLRVEDKRDNELLKRMATGEPYFTALKCFSKITALLMQTVQHLKSCREINLLTMRAMSMDSVYQDDW